jgi:hypothetical protein
VAVEEPPDRADPRLVLTLGKQAVLDFLQRQIGLPPNQFQQPFFILFERRPALPLDRLGLDAAGLPPPLDPTDCRRVANLELPCSSSRRDALFNNSDHSNTQVVRIAQAHRWPPLSEKATESYSHIKGNPLDSQKVETALVDAHAGVLLEARDLVLDL